MSLIDHNGDVAHIVFGGQAALQRLELPDKLIPVDASNQTKATRRDELARRAVAILQSANALFERGVYNLR
jgi:hypothetical protein